MMLMIDGYQNNNVIVIQTFVAGVDIENLLISVTCKTVTINGERRTRQDLAENVKNNTEDYIEQELSWGTFSRTITLPSEIEINQVESNIDHGLLTIKLPIINKNRSKIIKIKTI
jgi:HSP20 family protein